MSPDNVPQLNLESIFVALYRLITRVEGGGDFIEGLRIFWDTINTIAVFTAPLFLFGIIYVVIRTYQLRKEEREQFQREVQKAKGESRGDERWQHIVNFVASENPTEWRHGIIDADVMLDELLTERGYSGDTLGEKLKSISPGSMRTLDAAWEAHKVRNQIAHAGSDFILTQREARRAIDSYRQVFDELEAL